MAHILFLDTETGGLRPQDAALLTVGSVLLDDETGDLLMPQEWFIRARRDRCNPRALEVNGINLLEHNKKAMKPRQFVASFTGALVLYAIAAGLQGENPKLRIGGHNINFDIRFIAAAFEKEGLDINNFFDYHYDDTMPVGRFLCGKGKLTELCEYFQVDYPKAAQHTALGDSIAAAKLWYKMKYS